MAARLRLRLIKRYQAVVTDMSEHRERMMSALKTRFVPALRQRGFVGSFPHFRRRLPDRIDYLTVQFYSAGGSFVVEVGRTGPDGFTDGPWKHLPIDKINVGHLFDDRRRLAPRDAHGGGRGGDWFEFGPRGYDFPVRLMLYHAERPLPPVRLRDAGPTSRARSERAPLDAGGEIPEVVFPSLAVGLPRFAFAALEDRVPGGLRGLWTAYAVSRT